VASPSHQVRQALSTLPGLIRQRPAENETIIRTISDTRRTQAVDLQLTQVQLDAMKATERAIAADERFEHLVPAEDPIQEFANDCATDRKTNHVTAFMRRYGQEATERACYFGVEFLSVKEPAELAGIRLLPLDDPEIPETNPLFKLDKTITSYAVVRITGTNDVLMAARARDLAEHALRVLRIALRQTYAPKPEQLRFRLGTSYAFADRGGGWQRHDDIAYPLELVSDLTSVLAAAAAGLPPTATKKSINEKALLAAGWLDRALFTPDLVVATLYRFFALESLLGDSSDGLKNGPLALRQMTLSAIATGHFRPPDNTFLAYKEVRSFAVHGEVAPAVIPQQADHFARAVQDTLDQYLTIANQHGYTKRRQLMDLLDNYPDRDKLIAWIREHGSDKWGEYLDSITASPDTADHTADEDEEQGPADPV
jgi:hypothetical protein